MKSKMKVILSSLLLLSIIFNFEGCVKITIRSLTPSISDSFEKEDLTEEYWDMREETIESPPEKNPVEIIPLFKWFENSLRSEDYTYVYGGKTATKIQKGTTKKYYGIFACYFDNDEYSGVTLVLGGNKNINIESILQKNEKAGIGFWIKGGKGNEKIYLGILDDNSDGMKVQSRVALRDFGKIDTSWSYFMIPLKKFSSTGKYWDENKKMEIVNNIDWTKISEIRFSTNKGENSTKSKEPVKIYIADLCIIKEIPGFFDSEKYWKTFKSTKPDRLLHDFENPSDWNWVTGKGPASEVKAEVVNSNDNKYGKKSLSITYKVNDWCDVIYDYVANGTPSEKCDWRDYWGIKFNLFTSKPYQALNIQINDAGNEVYIASCGGGEGWSEIIVPFKNFYKFPYYQPENARHDGNFDLEKILMLDIKPAGEGTSGTFLVDNIRLTNDREPKSEDIPKEKKVIVSGNFKNIVTPNINEGIFGINATHWDGDLLHPETAEKVKAINHKVIRFPGGLSADEYHWEEILNKKDINVDIDEFINFCEKTNCEPMITVNFGTGTPQEAAKWVEYLNVKKKKKVRYWEIGNELYGNWHKNHCSAAEYGKRSVEFIKAMKAIDPDILITVVWELDGEWNKIVFEYVKDIVDGVNVHHYPQESGQENDLALLSSPQTLDNIIGRVREQLSQYGNKNKKYEIWLTEWNSVDFNPGPQSLSIVNGLFVADYLGMLAKNNIEQASYWNIHNGLFEQGGDYGYLSRSDFKGGVNVPRPSYWAFKLASVSLRGSLVCCSTDDRKVSVYASLQQNSSKSLLIINKYPSTMVNLSINISEFKGKGKVLRLDKNNCNLGYSEELVEIKETPFLINLPPYSITSIIIK